MSDKCPNISPDGKLHVVLDTSVLAGAIIYNVIHGTRIIEHVFQGDISAYVTRATISEHRHLFSNEKTKNGVPITDFHRQLLEDFIFIAKLTDTTDDQIKDLAGTVDRSNIQRQDWKFLILAAVVSARFGCCYLVSNDHDLTNLSEPLKKLEIYTLNSEEFMDVLS